MLQVLECYFGLLLLVLLLLLALLVWLDPLLAQYHLQQQVECTGCGHDVLNVTISKAH